MPPSTSSCARLLSGGQPSGKAGRRRCSSTQTGACYSATPTKRLPGQGCRPKSSLPAVMATRTRTVAVVVWLPAAFNTTPATPLSTSASCSLRRSAGQAPGAGLVRETLPVDPITLVATSTTPCIIRLTGSLFHRALRNSFFSQLGLSAPARCQFPPGGERAAAVLADVTRQPQRVEADGDRSCR